MSAHELARKLLDGPDLPVCLAVPARDYWNTLLAPEVGRLDRSSVNFSAYHGLDVVAEPDATAKDVILIR